MKEHSCSSQKDCLHVMGILNMNTPCLEYDQEENKFFIETDDASKFVIEYCPWCGKKLATEKEKQPTKLDLLFGQCHAADGSCTPPLAHPLPDDSNE